MRTEFGVQSRVEGSLRIDPRLVLSSHLLQLAQPDLEQAVEAELAENPALERLQDDVEPLEEGQILRRLAPDELRPSSDDREFNRSICGNDDQLDWIDLAPGMPSLRNHLVAQVDARIRSDLAFLGQYLVDSLNAQGYLEEPTEEIALATNCSIEDVEEALQALQDCEPAGVGARDVRECLLLQLRRPATVEQRLARSMLKHCIDDFMARRTMKIAHRFGVMPSVVEAGYDEIQKLHPYPAQSFAPFTSQATSSAVAAADICIDRSESGWHVSVKGMDSGSLQVSRAYRQRLGELARSGRSARDEKRHLSLYVQRADDFIACLNNRHQTLLLVGEYLVAQQPSFLSTGDYQFLRPLTRSQLAVDLGIHESTVSRATADKFVQIPTGEIVAFEVFFKPALRIQKMIEEILSTENPDRPLSDVRIAEILSDRGVSVARRTVNKYRDRTRLLSSRRRKTA